MTAPRVVLFDYGHTLVDFRRVPSALVAAYEDIRRRLERHVSHELPQAEALAHQITDAVDIVVHRSYSEGRIQELDVVELLVDAFAGIGIPVDGELAAELAVLDHQAFSHSISVPAATLSVLESLAAQGTRMGLVSNITLLPRLLRADLDAMGVGQYLGAMAFSSEVGWRKPDRRIFAYALERLGATAQEAVMVGDRLRDDISGARAAGMATVLTREFRNELDGAERAEGLRAGPAMATLRPDHAIDSLSELPGLLKAWPAPRSDTPG
ncbi:MAG: hypothetical protein NVSMB32_03200 [Actinomycetota bacterium]